MIKEIKYGGMSSATSDYECNDGELDFAQNCINEGRGIEGIPSFVVSDDKVENEEGNEEGNESESEEDGEIDGEREGESDGDEGDEGDDEEPTVAYRPVYLHDDRIIGVAENSLYYKYGDNDWQCIKEGFTINVETAQFNSIGNSLIVTTGWGDTDTVYYFLWKTDGYKSIGDTPPMIELCFGLQSQYRRYDLPYYRKLEGTELDPLWREFDPVPYGWEPEGAYRLIIINNEDGIRRLSEACYAEINSLIEECNDKGYFALPFFIRYAYRLYDGSLLMHSAPVLMIPNSMGIRVCVSSSDGKLRHCLAVCNACILDYRVIKGDATLLEPWKDIIKSIDIFVSAPIYPFTTSGKITHFRTYHYNKSFGIYKNVPETSTGVYGRHGGLEWVGLRGEQAETGELSCVLQSNPNFRDDIKDVSTFYHLTSLSLENLPNINTTKNLEFTEGILKTLVTREVMTDDYDSHFAKNFKSLYAYNSRLIAANVKKTIHINQSLASRLPYIGSMKKRFVTVDVNEEGNLLQQEENTPNEYNTIHYVFFPFTEATKMMIHNSGTSLVHYFSLRKSDFLNGTFFFSGFDDTSVEKEEDPPIGGSSIITKLPNKIYVSEVNNPFVFPAVNIHTVGDAPITALGVSTQAVSDGQFGQYPFYVFSEDGTWALEVNDIGVPSKPKPISRLVATSPKSMQSIDTEFLFASKNGVYSLVGATPTLISRKFKENAFFDFYSGTTEVLSKFKDVATELKHTIAELQNSFVDYIDGAVIAYDYLHKRIFFSNSNYGYTYVFSIATGEWYTTNNIVFIDALNSYPEAKVVTQDSNGYYHIVDLANFGDATPSTLITRPLKLDLPDTFKTVERVIQRGNFAPDNVQQILYGSNDLVTWRPLASSRNKYISGLRGHSYKYFRLALFMNLNKGESLTGCTIQFTEKGTNKLR